MANADKLAILVGGGPAPGINSVISATTIRARLQGLEVLGIPVAGALPGMSAQASISTDTRDGAVVVPIQAVTVRTERELSPKEAGAPEGPQQPQGPLPPGKNARRDPLRKVVFVMEDGAARARPVETGLASDTEIENVSRLKAGEKVVEGPYRVLSRELKDGKKLAEKKPGGPAKKE